jgi:hypothetical protein
MATAHGERVKVLIRLEQSSGKIQAHCAGKVVLNAHITMIKIGGDQKGGNVEFVMFEDVDGMEVFVNPERVIWVREYPNHTTVISCGHDDKFAVRLAPAHAVAALGKTVR